VSFESTSTLQQPDDVSAAAAASSGSLGGGGGGGTGIEVIQLDASGGNVTETLPSPSAGATTLALRVDTSTGNTATLETADSSQEIRFAEGKNESSTTLNVEQSLLLSSDGSHWYVEEGQGLSAEAEAVTTDAATKDSPSLTQTATYDSDGTTSVTSSDVSIERYVRTDTDGNATLVYESGGTEIARLSDEGRFETRADQEAFADGSFGSGSSTNSLLQVEDAGTVLTTDAASLNFTGSGLSLSQNGDKITIDVSGGSGSDINIESNQSTIVGGATGLSFEGAGVDSVDNDGDGTATVNISKGSSTEVQEGGTAQVSDVTVLDFIGSDFSIDTPTGGEAEVGLQNNSVTVAGNSVPLGGSTGINHRDLSSIGSSDHHAKTTSAADLTDVSADSVTDAHHAKYTDSDAVDALQAHDGTNVDADTLDGVEGGNYARTDVNEKFTEEVVIQEETVVDSISGLTASGNSQNTDWNLDYQQKIEGANNALAFIVPSDTNNREAAIQSGHVSGNFSDVPGDLYLNPVGGDVVVGGNAGFGGETAPSYALDVAGTAAASTVRLGDYTVEQDGTDGDLNFFHTGSKVLELTDGGILRAAGDVVAFGLSGGSSGGASSGLQVDAPLTLDTTTDPDTIGLSVGSGLTVTNGTLEADESVGVSSVFGRTGDVTASSGDYSASQIGGFDSAAVSAVNSETSLSVDISGDADTLDGHDESYFGALSENETVTGDWEFANGIEFGFTSSLYDSGSPSIITDYNNDQPNTNFSIWADGFPGDSSAQQLAQFGTGANETFITAGNVGIETTSPSYALEVSGDMRATGEVEAFISSDRRLKTGLDTLDSALNKVDQLTGYGFDWREGGAVQPHKRGETDVGIQQG